MHSILGPLLIKRHAAACALLCCAVLQAMQERLAAWQSQQQGKQ
jgi:hypothetical protein